jgi:hypothetical protein
MSYLIRRYNPAGLYLLPVSFDTDDTESINFPVLVSLVREIIRPEIAGYALSLMQSLERPATEAWRCSTIFPANISKSHASNPLTTLYIAYLSRKSAGKRIVIDEGC